MKNFTSISPINTDLKLGIGSGINSFWPVPRARETAAAGPGKYSGITTFILTDKPNPASGRILAFTESTMNFDARYLL